ncbi:MAG: PVC-type heme-binding CxxCH protein [Phycisphaeraceae bacterium]
MVVRSRVSLLLALLALAVAAGPCLAQLQLRRADHIAFIGNNLAERAQHDGWIETLIQTRFPKHELVFRNLGFTGDEVNKRPRSDGFGSPDQWLKDVKADVVFAFFGYNESFAGAGGLDKFRKDLAAFVDQTLKQNYSGKGNARLVLISPIAHEDLKNPNLPDGSENNARLELYTKAMQEIAKEKSVPFVALFSVTKNAYAQSNKPLTMNGIHLTTEGNLVIAKAIDASLFGPSLSAFTDAQLNKLRLAVVDKNFHWFSRYRTVDAYNVFGGRSRLAWHGQSNADVMMREMEIFSVMASNRDKRVHAIAQGGDLTVDDSNVPPLVEVKTNKPGPLEGGKYPFLGGEEAIGKMKIAKGMKVNLFASEEQFPDLINPVQMAVDTNGRLWVATWPTYPHWNPTEPMRDKLVILPDDNGDGKADRMVVFADGLNSVTGFEFWGGGVLVAAAPELLFLKDTDGDDKADVKIRMLQGISAEDTHHTANALTIGPDGGLYYSHGVFHVDAHETPTRTFRSTNTGVYRFDPRTYEVEFHHPIGPNPHGNAFDRWGFQFANDGTGGEGDYVAIGKGAGAPKHWFKKTVRPVPAIGILSSSHFPPENEGNFLVCNAIGFLGVKQYEVKYNGAEITAEDVESIVVSSDPNFRPTDLEVGGDGALYISDWCNPIIGHMQHNIRDPSRDHDHGRVYRVTYEGRPLVTPVKMMGKPIPQVLAAFYAKENGTRYRARLELSGRETKDVTAAVTAFADKINIASGKAEDEQALLECLWTFEEHRMANRPLLVKVLQAKESRVRAAAIRTFGHWGAKVSDWESILLAAARDTSALVRAEAVVAAPSFEGLAAAEAIFEVSIRPTDVQLDFVLKYAKGKINVDKLVSDAIGTGKPLSPAAMEYALLKANVASLLKMNRTEAVCLALLSRPGVNEKDRKDALNSLASIPGIQPLKVLISTLDNPDGKFDNSLGDLAGLLAKWSAAELKAASNDVLALAERTKEMTVKQAAYTALIAADGSTDRVMQLAGASMLNMRAFITSLESVTDRKVLNSAYPAVKELTHSLPSTLNAEVNANPGTVGRFVRVELPGNGTLTLVEVEVYSAGANVARGKPAKQSTVANGGTADKAVDGNTNTVFGAGSATHTNENSKNPWWEVDLGAEYAIDSIKIWNRTDCCSDRLQGFSLKVLDAARAEVLHRANNKLETESIALALGGDPAAAIHAAAIRTLVAIPGHDRESFDHLTSLIASNRQPASAISALLALDRKQWSRDKAPALAAALRKFVPTIPLNKRTGKTFEDSQTVAKEIAAMLPGTEGESLLRDLADLNLQVVRIETIPERMLYDKSRFAVVAGKPVRIVLHNRDGMPHNLLVVKPGGPEVVGPLAEAMGADGFKKHFRPDHAVILHGTGLVQPGEIAEIEFIAPTTPGDYEYVCTFPGHWRLMRGVMKVVATPADLPSDAAGAKLVVTNWKVEDLEPDLEHIAHGRSFEAGKATFTKLGCAQCHKIGGAGGALGPDLTEVFKKWKDNRRDLLVQILEPSKVIEDKFKAADIELDDGDRIFGLVTAREKDHLLVVTGGTDATPRKIMKKNILAERATSSSLMPQGLLGLLQRGDILDLLAYLEAGGDPKHMLYKH